MSLIFKSNSFGITCVEDEVCDVTVNSIVKSVKFILKVQR